MAGHRRLCPRSFFPAGAALHRVEWRPARPRFHGAFEHYTLAVFFYVLMLMVIGKAVGLGLDYYGFRLEQRFNLSNQKLRAWVWDETKGFLVGVALASIVVEMLYFSIRQFPQNWWLIAW